MAAACAFVAVQSDKVAAYMRHRHLQGPRWVRKLPFAGMVMKNWYPTYLRVTGIGGFICAAWWLMQVTRLFSE